MKTPIVLALLCAHVAQADPFDDPVVHALEDELARSKTLALDGAAKPYFISFTLSSGENADVHTSLGSLIRSDRSPNRSVDIDVRVGDRTFDNGNFGSGGRDRGVNISKEADYGSVRRAIWLAVDREYKQAVETLERKQAVVKAEAPNPDEIGAMSVEPPIKIVADHPVALPDLPRLEALGKKLSAVFRNNPDVQEGTAAIHVMAANQVFLSTEGSRSIQAVGVVRITVIGHTQAADGMPIHDTLQFWAPTFDQLPSEADMVAQVEKLSAEISALKKAPLVDDFNGPVVFRGIAAGQVVRILLSEHFSGTLGVRPDRPGGTSTGESELIGKIGQRILPAGTTVIEDPTISKLGKLLLVGGVQFDEEGVRSQKVSLVENGVLKRFLMSRLPRKGFEHSTGHAGSTVYSAARAHPDQLIVTAPAVSGAQLAQKARASAKDLGVGYYYVVDKLSQESRGDDRPSPEETLLRPVVMKRVYVDGREELVRGGSFGPVPTRMLRDATFGDVQTAYSYLGSGMPSRLNVMMGGDSPNGFIATIVTPSLMLKEVDVKKPRVTRKRPPVAPRPTP